MKFAAVFIFVCSSLLWAQATAFENPKPAAPLSPKTVVATIEGKNVTYGEIETYLRGLTPQMQQNAMNNRKQFIQQFALMQRLSELAEKEKLAEKSPYREALAFNRMNVLSQAQINEQYNNFVVGGEELHKFYDTNKNRYEQVKVKVIYISFSPNPGQGADGKKRLSEAEAKEKAERLVKEIKGGADFLKLVKENSEDETSKAKDGDFGTLSRADNLPDAIRSSVFTLKAGDISDPVRQPNGYYIFRAEEVVQKPFDDVQNQIYSELKNLRLKQWLETTTKELKIEFVDTDFFAGSGMPGAPATPAPAAKPSLAK